MHISPLSVFMAILAQISMQKETIYHCSPAKLMDDKCLVIETNETDSKNNTYHLQNCPTDQTCTKDGIFGFCKWTLRQKFGGEKCGISAECFSNNCTASYCVSKADGQLCTSTYECSFKSYCNSDKKCAAQLAVDTECKKDEDCVPGLACGKKTDDKEKEKCYALFSFDIGVYTTNRLLCKTGYAYRSGNYDPFSDKGICSLANRTSSEECMKHADCTYTINTGTSNLTENSGPNCQVSSDGISSYCKIATNNTAWDNWLREYKYAISGFTIYNTQNNRYLRETRWGAPRLMQATANVENYNLMKNADQCATRFHSSSSMIKASFALIAALIMLFL